MRAVDVLEPLVAQVRNHQLGRLCLGLSYLRKGAGGDAEEAFTALRDPHPSLRLAVQLDRAARLLRGEPLSDETREFIATSLEHETESAQEIHELRSALAYRTRALLPTPEHRSRAQGTPTTVAVEPVTLESKPRLFLAGGDTEVMCTCGHSEKEHAPCGKCLVKGCDCEVFERQKA